LPAFNEMNTLKSLRNVLVVCASYEMCFLENRIEWKKTWMHGEDFRKKPKLWGQWIAACPLIHSQYLHMRNLSFHSTDKTSSQYAKDYIQFKENIYFHRFVREALVNA
jgi:hypothetical protein